MKVMIQNSENLLYLQSLGHWSADINSAFDFGNSDDAVQFCAAHGITPVQVVLQWSGNPHSIIIPITSSIPLGEKALHPRKHA